jgi:3-oxoacyl-[acyl-carrier protein] reductase
MDLGLNGKTAIVLGGSQGLGLGVARALLQEGATVLISSRSAEGLEAARGAMPEADRARCHIVAADLGAADAVDVIVAEARRPGRH